MVDRRSPFRVEARRSSAPQTQFYPSLANYPNNRISWLRRGCYSPPKRFRFVPMWGCPQTALRRIMLSLTGHKGSNSKLKQEVEQRAWGSGVGGVMHEIENLQDSAEHCFELATSQNFMEDDIALEAFELLTANEY